MRQIRFEYRILRYLGIHQFVTDKYGYRHFEVKCELEYRYVYDHEGD
jgi:hypothetical protein